MTALPFLSARALDLLQADLAHREGTLAGRRRQALGAGKGDAVDWIVTAGRWHVDGGGAIDGVHDLAANYALKILQSQPYESCNAALAYVAVVVTLGRGAYTFSAPVEEVVVVFQEIKRKNARFTKHASVVKWLRTRSTAV